ncbi:putative flavonol 3-O-glucosyltransferase [Helianthus annuus]|nr:putative flavonol 3-O-glucosyltransferase [Helianthus annuus]
MANTAVAELIFIPTPGLGHIMSTIELAKLLVNRDQRLAITVLVIKPPGMTSGSAITTYIESLTKNTMDRISFIQLPQVESPPIHGGPTEFIKSHCKYVRNVVSDLTSQPGSGRVVGFVVDMFCTSMIDVANEFNVPTFVFFTSSAAFLGFTLFIKLLCDDLNRDVVELSNSDTEISVPSFVKPVPTKVFWSLVKTREGLDSVQRLAKKLGEAKGIIVNTFLDLETHAIESLSADISVPPVYPVGPILNLEGGSGGGKPFDDDVIRWLDRDSTWFRAEWSPFLMVPTSTSVRANDFEDPKRHEDPSVVLPEGFLDRTRGIGKVIGWAPQVAVLAHDAVGGFVSHCGWNSLLESLWFGVPSATWPMYGEQQMNAFEMVVDLGLAVEIKLDYEKDVFNPFNPKANKIINVTAGEIESGIRRVMEDNEVRVRVKEMSAKSRAAVVEGGSSYAFVRRLLQDFIRD